MKKIIPSLFIIISIFLLSSCNSALNEYKKNYIYFNTDIEIIIYKDEYPNQEFDEINELLSLYHNLTDRYYPHNVNGLYYINSHSEEVINIQKELFDLIKYSIDESNKILNDDYLPYFNILVGSITDIYKELFDEYLFLEVSDEIYSNLDLEKEINLDQNSIELDEENLTIKIKENMSIDLGGVVKGYVTSLIADYLDSKELYYSIQIGASSIITNYGNPNRKNNAYLIGLTDPVDTKKIYSILNAPKRKVIATSGDYQKYFIYNNKRYSHILNPYKKEPVFSDIRSITIVMDDVKLSDIYSTILYMMGKDKAISYMNLNDIDYIIYTIDDEIIVSSNLKKLVTIKKNQ